MLTQRFLFLDFDGVMNSRQCYESCIPEGRHTQRTLCPLNGAWLEEIIAAAPGTKIVVSSTWRLGTTVEELAHLLSPWVDRSAVAGKTGIERGPRGKQIMRWMASQPWGKREEWPRYAILDDNDFDMDPVRHALVRTRPETGLTETEARAVVVMLGAGPARFPSTEAAQKIKENRIVEVRGKRIRK